jgi:hypothetical protein
MRLERIMLEVKIELLKLQIRKLQRAQQLRAA